MSTVADISEFLTIRIKNLRLRTIVGINAWERTKRQDVVINVRMRTLAPGESLEDTIGETVKSGFRKGGRLPVRVRTQRGSEAPKSPPDMAQDGGNFQAAVDDTCEIWINYRDMTKKIITLVEGSSFNLLESLAAEILKAVLSTEGVVDAVVEVDKPHALRFADSVSVTVEGRRMG